MLVGESCSTLSRIAHESSRKVYEHPMITLLYWRGADIGTILLLISRPNASRLSWYWATGTAGWRPWLCCGRGSFGIPLGDRITIFRKEPFDGSAAGHGAIAGRTGCDAGRLEKGVGTVVACRDMPDREAPKQE